jgi:hypothetical protein
MATNKYRLLVTLGDMKETVESRAAQLGISASEYIRRLVYVDNKRPYENTYYLSSSCKECKNYEYRKQSVKENGFIVR